MYSFVQNNAIFCTKELIVLYRRIKNITGVSATSRGYLFFPHRKCRLITAILLDENLTSSSKMITFASQNGEK